MMPARFNLDTQTGSDWLYRAEIAAGMVSRLLPARSLISDLGCGDRKMKKYLKGYRYKGYDLIRQHRHVMQFDITKDSIPVSDAILLLGVLEYIPNPQGVLKRIDCPLVVSHLNADSGQFSDELVAEKGWLNVMRQKEFEAMLEDCRFTIVESALTPGQGTRVWAAVPEN